MNNFLTIDFTAIDNEVAVHVDVAELPLPLTAKELSEVRGAADIRFCSYGTYRTMRITWGGLLGDAYKIHFGVSTPPDPTVKPGRTVISGDTWDSTTWEGPRGWLQYSRPIPGPSDG